MDIEVLKYDLTVCKVRETDDIDLKNGFCFVGVTGEEISLVCETEKTPADTIKREDGWKGLKIIGELDFSLVGILSGIASILADNGISIFAVSTFNTDYILIKKNNLAAALKALENGGCNIIKE